MEKWEKKPLGKGRGETCDDVFMVHKNR